MPSVLRPDSRLGQMVGNYQIRGVIAHGGMGCVFLAEHPDMGRRAALKIIHPRLAQDPALVMRFLNEARVCAKLHHPNVVDVFDLGTLPDGAPYVLMELLEGTTLAWVINTRRQLPLSYALDVVKQTAQGLRSAHELGVVHRDVKPDNLFLVVDPRDRYHALIKVLDFGVAKLMGGSLLDPRFKTAAGTMLGTPAYMSPEQFGNSDEVDARADQYSLGVILFEMLAGRLPFSGATFGDLAIAHQNAAVPSLAPFMPDVADRLDPILARALSKQPEARFASLAEFVEALELCCENLLPHSGRPSSPKVTLVPSPQIEGTSPGPAGTAATKAERAHVFQADVFAKARRPASARSTWRVFAWASVVCLLAVGAFLAADSGLVSKRGGTGGGAGRDHQPAVAPYEAEPAPTQQQGLETEIASMNQGVAEHHVPQPEQTEHLRLPEQAEKPAEASRGATWRREVGQGSFQKRRERGPQMRRHDHAASQLPPRAQPNDTYVPEPI